jgi:hypothetical protein
MNQKKDNIEWHRNKVQELLVKGYNHYEIASTLKISRPTITKDIQYLRQCAKQNIKRYINERLLEEYEKCLLGLTAILREAWNTADLSFVCCCPSFDDATDNGAAVAILASLCDLIYSISF